jgi:hypothetical protein
MQHKVTCAQFLNFMNALMWICKHSAKPSAPKISTPWFDGFLFSKQAEPRSAEEETNLQSYAMEVKSCVKFQNELTRKNFL